MQSKIKSHSAYHLGVLHRGFWSDIFDENLTKNLDEIHFTINMDNRQTLSFWDDTFVKYVDIVAGGQAMTMVV